MFDVSSSAKKLAFIWQVQASREPFCIKQDYKSAEVLVIAILSKIYSTLEILGQMPPPSSLFFPAC